MKSWSDLYGKMPLLEGANLGAYAFTMCVISEGGDFFVRAIEKNTVI